ncbi:hypothetical protein TcasGA2_TC032781 [Tribolium castaneum]|uniref:Uncharacterized protein n=1 Tax=Tribolium castaneum TaxID=7070 RepID=A0A139WIV5_TRICA|nr:PREDICTED: uncharacterized protein LOC103312626 [Tribolium castaneum]KYB27893.1 hypothetical protein TcasGA2_TC032781 [Tribolium castaneum]|eukprot:XP_008191915.1 PREDICTED: uncharacterized protein LOC103312626 [Tribolium castaneum]
MTATGDNKSGLGCDGRLVHDMIPKFDFSLKRRVILIGGLHGAFLGYGMFEAIRKIIEEERPLTPGDVAYLLIHLLSHLFLIGTLVAGALFGNALLLLPWLVAIFPVFAILSYFIIIFSTLSYVSQFLFNIFFISVNWYLWFTVYQYFRQCKNPNHRRENNYKLLSGP